MDATGIARSYNEFLLVIRDLVRSIQHCGTCDTTRSGLDIPLPAQIVHPHPRVSDQALY